MEAKMGQFRQIRQLIGTIIVNLGTLGRGAGGWWRPGVRGLVAAKE